ncbi:hypothetical protein B0H12DRAFT_1061197 [Mycena haematopus]|nr:hypothetical protein B0H12DRAFT_1061197 [Mycena haematopus]
MSDPIPVPFLTTFLTVALKVLEACQEASMIEENVKNLQGRVYNIMLIVINSAVPLNEKTFELRERIETLQSVLAGILTDLAKIKEQGTILLVFLPNPNKDRVDRCVGRLAVAVEKFQLASQIRVETTQLRVEELLAKIKAEQSIILPELHGIAAAVKQLSQPHNAPYPREDMPLPHRIFYGREPLVGEITSLLATKSTSRVCITGVGGMGKTSVGLAVAESATKKNIFRKEHIFWVPCVEAKSSDLLRRILHAQLRITAETYDSLEPLIAELDASKLRRLLLLDNFETPWLSSGDQVKVHEILVQLAKLPQIGLLVTMTSGFPPEDIEWQHRPLNALDPAAARDAFKSKYRDAAGGHELVADGPELDKLLASIGRIPLAITLTAASGGCLGISPNDLLKDWREEGTQMMSGNQTRSMDDTIRSSMERGVVKSNPEALELLAILSLLPAGTTGSNLDWWAPMLNASRRHAAVKTLRTAALIEFESDGQFDFATSHIFVRPTIQSYMSHKGRISTGIRDKVHDACYKFVLDHKSIPDDPKSKGDLEALATEETNIQGLLMEIPVDAPRPNAVDALIAFGLYQSRTKPSTVVASHALAVARAVYDDSRVTDRDAAAARRVAAAHLCLGKSLFALDRYDEARTHFEEASTRFKDLPGGADLHCAGEASTELLATWMFKGIGLSPELESLAEEAQANLSYDETSRYHVARGLLGLGHFLWWSQRLDQALETLSAAKSIFEHQGCPASTAECLYYMARSYAYGGECAEALPIIKDALGKANQSGEVGLICDALSTTAGLLMDQRLYDEASAIISQLLSLSHAVGAPLDIAQGLELLAYNCAATMDLPGARVAYQGARIHFTKIQSTRMGAEGVDRCSDNLRRLEGRNAMNRSNFLRLEEPIPMY